MLINLYEWYITVPVVHVIIAWNKKKNTKITLVKPIEEIRARSSAALEEKAAALITNGCKNVEHYPKNKRVPNWETNGLL